MTNSNQNITPLIKKLGIKKDFLISIINPPSNYNHLISIPSEYVKYVSDISVRKNFIHIFCQEKNELEILIKDIKSELKPEGYLWISWPKKSSKVKTDLDGNIVRNMGLEIGLVDIKVCSINNIWSALKFVIPIKDR
ncbi:DUF3052 domain-containing protein [Marinigracilibium pacificum]|uniref:DUF3052 domain-containing protein n=1 Tax=Marinigracilibium pacificum TaxID=2729599 RepID=A0A848J0I0_9BACT|nr:DUF3052 domain-containing protein [Marinigracilibium pacificum]NMM47779.1 DUF3052 domain-containing protein [Marinigracilibium pacificum]